MYIGGLGVIIFGFWTVLRLLLGVVLGSQKIIDDEVMANIPEEIADDFVLYVYLILAILCILIIVLHTFIGINSMRFAKDKKYRKIFILFSLMLMVFQFLIIPSYVTQFMNIKDLDTVFAAAIVDITFTAILIDINLSYFRVKRLIAKRAL